MILKREKSLGKRGGSETERLRESEGPEKGREGGREAVERLLPPKDSRELPPTVGCRYRS